MMMTKRMTDKLNVTISVKDVEPMNKIVIAAFELCCLHRTGTSIPKHKFFDLEMALNAIGVNEEEYVNPCLVAGDTHAKE